MQEIINTKNNNRKNKKLKLKGKYLWVPGKKLKPCAFSKYHALLDNNDLQSCQEATFRINIKRTKFDKNQKYTQKLLSTILPL